MRKIWTPNLTDILPDSVLKDAKLRASAEALSFELEKLSAATREVLHLPRLDELSGLILDHLAEQFHVDFYEPLYLTEDEKRNLIRESIAWHRIKGTTAAVEQIANAAFREAAITEWQDYGGLPYRFKITTKGFKETPDGFATFLRMIRASKNVRSWLDDITIVYDETAEKIYAGAALGIQGLKQIHPAKPPTNYISRVSAGNILAIQGKRDILPAIPRLNSRQNLFGGQILVKSGEIILDFCREDLPKHGDIFENALADLLIADVGLARGGEIQPRVMRHEENLHKEIFAAQILSINGNKTIEPSKPRDSRQKFFAGTAFSRQGEISIGTDTTRKFKHNLQPIFGSALVKAGTIHIDSITKPSDVPDLTRRFDGEINPRFGVGLLKSGSIEIGVNPQITQNAKSIFHACGMLIRCGEITILPSRVDLLKPFTLQDKSKLDSIEDGAQVNVVEKISLNGEPLEVVDKSVDIEIGGMDKPLAEEGHVAKFDSEGGVIDGGAVADDEFIRALLDEIFSGLALFTAALKAKLDSIEDGAQVNVVEKMSLNGEPLEVTDKAVDVEISGMDKPLAEEGHVAKFDSEGGVIDGGAVADDEFIRALLDEIFAGLALFTADDKSKLDSIEDGAQVNVVEEISLNGKALAIADKVAAINLPAMNKPVATEGHISAFDSEGGLVDGDATFADDNAINEMLDEIFGTKSNFSDGDRLRIFFDFPCGAARAVQLQNPRGDLSVAEIKKFGNKTAELKILQNSKGALTTGINRAELIRDVDLKLARDGDTLPAADALKLSFGKNQTTVKNLRSGVTIGEIKRLDKLAANIFNGKLKRAALVKNFKIDDSDAKIKF